MSQENVEAVRPGLRGVQPRGLGRPPRVVHPDAEYDVSAAIGPYAGMYYGRAAIRNLLADYFETWESVRLEPEDFIEVAIALSSRRLHTVAREVVPRLRLEMTQVWTVRDRMAVRVAAYNDRAEALEAVGLSE